MVTFFLEKSILWRTPSFPSLAMLFIKWSVHSRTGCKICRGGRCITSKRSQIIWTIFKAFLPVLRTLIDTWHSFSFWIHKKGASFWFMNLEPNIWLQNLYHTTWKYSKFGNVGSGGRVVSMNMKNTICDREARLQETCMWFGGGFQAFRYVWKTSILECSNVWSRKLDGNCRNE